MIIVNDENNRSRLQDRARIIQEHLRSLNPEWKDGWFEYDVESRSLRIGGVGLTRLSESKSILAALQPKHLDISQSDISQLWQESSYPIETLDLRGCPFTTPHAHVLSRFIHLKELKICPDQKELRRFVLPWVEVIEEELDSKPQ